MSDIEDNDDIYLDEIKALEDILAQETPDDNIIDEEIEDEIDDTYSKVNLQSPEILEFENDSDSDSQDNLLENNEQNQVITDSESIQTSIDANAALIESYQTAKALITARLEKCKKRIEDTDLKIKLAAKVKQPSSHVPYTKAGMPYFKDSKMFPAPLNEDAIQKSRRGELMIVYQPKPSRWSTRDRNNLWRTVRMQAATEFFEKYTRDKEKKNDDDDNEEEVQLPNNYKEMIGPLNSREFDWMRISAQLFNNRHSAEESRVMWNVYLHPDINKHKWKATEDKLLQNFSLKHRYQNWDAIAKDLETGRTGYQCFVRYNTVAGPLKLKSKDIPWSPKEDAILSKCVQKLRIGDYIPWSLIVYYIENRTKNQIYSHWKYNIDPSLKKGRFTEEEDQMLLDGVTKYGRDFPKISTKLIPHRTSVQLSTRFRLLMLKTDQKYNSWTIAEDKKLLELQMEYGSQWSTIARIMKKDRTYLRHRHTAILKYMDKGYSLQSIPRKRKHDEMENDESEADEIPENSEDPDKAAHDAEMKKIDDEILQFIQKVHVPNAQPVGRPFKVEIVENMKESAKELFKFLEAMEVRLDIPEDLSSDELTDEDVELLTVFKEYCRARNSETIEIYRKRMFPSSANTSTEHFIPPAPFSLFQNRKNKMVKQEIVDAQPSKDNCKIVLNMKADMKTPENINIMITDSERDSFSKISQLFSKKCKSNLKESYEQKLFPVMEFSNDDESSNGPPKDAMDRIWLKHPVGGENIKDHCFIEPSLSTIIGYDIIRNMREEKKSVIWTAKDIISSKKPVTSEGRRAFRMFKTRFMRLFKYPIGMTKISPTEIGQWIHIRLPHLPDDNTEDMDDDSDNE